MKRKGNEKEKPESKKKKLDKTVDQCKTQEELQKFNCTELKEYLVANGLSKAGNKPALVSRIFSHLCPAEKFHAVVTETLKEFLTVFASTSTEGTLFSRITPDLGNQIYYYWLHLKAARDKGTIRDTVYTYKSRIGMKGQAPGRLYFPSVMAIDGNGMIWICDQSNRRIQVWQKDGTSPKMFIQNLSSPQSMALMPDGDVVVLSFHGQVTVFSPEAQVKHEFGSRGQEEGKFSMPGDLVVDNQGRIIVADTQNHRLQVFTKSGTLLKVIGSKGCEVGQFSEPSAVTVDLFGNIIVGEYGNARIQILDPEGNPIKVFGQKGAGDEDFDEISGITVDANGTMIVSDDGVNSVKIFSREGKFIRKLEFSFDGPSSTALDKEGNILVVDTFHHQVLQFG